MRTVAAAIAGIALLASAASAAVITGTAQSDQLTGTPRADSIDGRAGNDSLRGLAGNDFLQGGAGRDTVEGGLGDDRIAAHADGARDRVRCGGGRDIVAAERTDTVGGDCEVVSRQLSVDTTTDPIGQHATEVEPDSFAFGSTVVAVFQVGRVFGGGAVAIGFSTSRDGGATWRPGLLPGTTDSSPRPGVPERASDPAVAFDAEHGTWLAVTLGISPRTDAFLLNVNRSRDGLAWSNPVAAVTGVNGQLDKEWVACDNGSASPFRGHCYVSYFDVPSGEIRTSTSTDGGLTWSVPVASSPIPPRGTQYNGAQPEVLPDGTLVVVFNAFVGEEGEETGGPFEIDATRSTDGGATFSGLVTAARFRPAAIPEIRTESLSSAEVDGSGRIYVAWDGCPGAGECEASRILLTTSVDGVSWTPVRRVTRGPEDVDHFMPGIGATAAATGKLAIVYHAIPDNCARRASCPGIDAFQQTSGNGGNTWTTAQLLTPQPMNLDWIARTSLGLMLGDYVSTSFSRGKPVSIFVVAAPRVGTAFREAVFAYRPRS